MLGSATSWWRIYAAVAETMMTVFWNLLRMGCTDTFKTFQWYEREWKGRDMNDISALILA
jgi:hypothetical protein